jgi:ParB family chromosome partitioning protein
MRRALGRGLSELLGEQAQGDLQQVAIDAISPNPNQPRKEFEANALAELAASIEKVGVMQPIVVRPTSEGKYELIAGERRWRAATIAGLETIPVVVKDADDMDTLQMALIENIQREDISPLELADAYRSLLEATGMTQEALAERIGKSRVSIANALRLAKLPEAVRTALRNGKITEGHARALLMFETDAERLLVLERIIAKKLSVREVERLAKSGIATPKIRENKQPDDLSSQVSERLGTPSRILRNKKGGGKIEIEFYDEDDLARIVDLLS